MTLHIVKERTAISYLRIFDQSQRRTQVKAVSMRGHSEQKSC